jgi:hypothetical protein
MSPGVWLTPGRYRDTTWDSPHIGIIQWPGSVHIPDIFLLCLRSDNSNGQIDIGRKQALNVYFAPIHSNPEPPQVFTAHSLFAQ